MYKIMVLDDDKFILASMQRSLRKKKEWQVETFFDPLSALESAQHEKYDMFISDYQMPGMNGIEFLTKIKTLQPFSVSIILSGDDDQRLVEKAINEAGIYQFVTKPVQSDELISAITSSLQFYEKNRNNKKQISDAMV